MRKRSSMILFLVVLLACLPLLNGCSIQRVAGKGKPIEPIAPGEQKGEAQALQGRFYVKSAGVQILDMDVTSDGSLAVVGTASRTVYLLERDGKLRWEKTLTSVPLKTYLHPSGRFILVGTAGGKLLLMNTDQLVDVEHHFNAPVGLVSATDDAQMILAGILAESPSQPDKLVIIDKKGTVQWEKTFDRLKEAVITGPENRVLASWMEKERPVVGMFSADGKLLWELKDRHLPAVDGEGKAIITARSQEVLFYNSEGQEQAAFTAPGPVEKVLISQDGQYVAVIFIDESTQNHEILYLSPDGEKLWSKRLPADSSVSIAKDGTRVVVASWRQYRDDTTQILVFNQWGREMVSGLEVAGRAHRIALADKDTLVLGFEDGGVFFLNAADISVNAAGQDTERTLTSFYHPVDFGRDEGESRLLLFFYDEAAQNLIPVTRRVKKTPSVLRASIEELIRGPIQGSSLNRTIPKDAEISVSHNEGIITIDLPVALDEMGGTTFVSGILDSLLLTVSQFPTVEQIGFTVGGKKKETFGQEGILINEGYAPRRFGRMGGERLLFIPVRSGPRYYLRPDSKALLPLKERALLETLVSQVISESDSFFPPKLTLQSVTIDNNTVYLDFNDALNTMITDRAEAAARAALLRDALALTIVENVAYSTVVITVNGKTPKSPEGYLPWEITVSRPYYLNPED